MYLLYSLFLTVAVLAFLPYFLFQALKHHKYLDNFRERLGNFDSSFSPHDGPAIWVHAVSVGEALSALPLLDALKLKYPEHRLVVSTTTATGQSVARARARSANSFLFFPFDWKFSVRRALAAVNPAVIILMESELWPNFLSECQRRGIPVLVANGRVSERAFKRSKKLRFLYARMAAMVSRFLMQSEGDAERIVALGADPKSVFVSGNLKYDIRSDGSSLPSSSERLLDSFQPAAVPLLIAGSTTEHEEEMVLEAFRQARKTTGLEKLRLLLAPRHPQRFEQVARLLDSSHFSFVRRSELESIAEAFLVTEGPDIILLDSIGELADLYRYASLVVVGGSLVPKGGHNILEPAALAKPVIVGPYVDNFRDIVEEFKLRDAVVQLESRLESDLIQELYARIVQLLNDPDEAQRIGGNAERAVSENRGATDRTLQAVGDLL